MSIRVVDENTIPDATQFKSGDVVVFPDRERWGGGAWCVSEARNGVLERPLGRFERQIHALCFAVAFQASGWPSAEPLRNAARDVIGARNTPELDERIADLAAALGVLELPPRVLVVVNRGIAQTFATPGVLVATADLDSQRAYGGEGLAAIHTDFGDLVRRAGVDWPLSAFGRRQSAVVMTPACILRMRPVPRGQADRPPQPAA